MVEKTTQKNKNMVEVLRPLLSLGIAKACIKMFFFCFVKGAPVFDKQPEKYLRTTVATLQTKKLPIFQGVRISATINLK